MKILFKQLLIIISSSSLVACASAPEAASEASEPVESSRSDCIYEGTIRDYTVLDDANLIVTATARRKYHIVLMRRAFGLRGSWHIGFTSPTNSICAGFSEVVVDDNMGPERIRIRSIRRLSADEADNLLIQYGKKKPEIEQTPTPEPVESAEVEELD